jgi:hypothetical protein
MANELKLIGVPFGQKNNLRKKAMLVGIPLG